MTSSARSKPQPQPLADERPRESFIRDLYSIAEFYTAHPEHPLPRSLTIYHAALPDEVARIAKQFHQAVYGDVAQTHHMLRGTSVPVTLLVSDTRPDRPL